MYRYCFFLLFVVCQASECPSWNNVYEGLGCEAVFDPSNSKCPVKYDCSKIKKTSKSQCFVNGKFYNDRDDIPDNQTGNPCKFKCSCRGSKLECPVVDCFWGRLDEGCFNSYGSSCCPEKVICRSDKSLATCVYKDKTYVEGESFNPDPCTDCICKKGFTGKLEEPFCTKSKCAGDDKYYDALVNKCAPIYLDDRCCPVAFSCAKGKEITVKSSVKSATENTCQFADKVLNIGDKVEVQEPVKSTCECIIPPLVSCKTKVSYNDVFNKVYG